MSIERESPFDIHSNLFAVAKYNIQQKERYEQAFDRQGHQQAVQQTARIKALGNASARQAHRSSALYRKNADCPFHAQRLQGIREFQARL